MPKTTTVPLRNIKVMPAYQHEFVAENMSTGEELRSELLAVILKAVRAMEDNHPWLHGSRIRSLILYDGEFRFKSPKSGDTWRLYLQRYIKDGVRVPVHFI